MKIAMVVQVVIDLGEETEDSWAKMFSALHAQTTLRREILQTMHTALEARLLGPVTSHEVEVVRLRRDMAIAEREAFDIPAGGEAVIKRRMLTELGASLEPFAVWSTRKVEEHDIEVLRAEVRVLRPVGQVGSGIAFRSAVDDFGASGG